MRVVLVDKRRRRRARIWGRARAQRAARLTQITTGPTLTLPLSGRRRPPTRPSPRSFRRVRCPRSSRRRVTSSSARRLPPSLPLPSPSQLRLSSLPSSPPSTPRFPTTRRTSLSPVPSSPRPPASQTPPSPRRSPTRSEVNNTHQSTAHTRNRDRSQPACLDGRRSNIGRRTRARSSQRSTFTSDLRVVLLPSLANRPSRTTSTFLPRLLDDRP